MKKRENQFLRVLTIESILFLIFTCVGLYFFPFLEAKEKEIGWQKEGNSVVQSYLFAVKAIEDIVQKKNDNTKLPLLGNYESPIDSEKAHIEKVKLEKAYSKDKNIENQKLGTSYVKIKKTGIKDVWGQLEHDYLRRKVSVILYGNSWEYIGKSDIEIVLGKQSYTIDRTKEIPILLNSYQCQQDSVILNFEANKIYTYKIYQDSEYIYITFCDPKNVYDKVVVVDAGHGGMDTGSYAKFGDWDEKDFNLDMVKKIKESWNHENIKLYFTRLEDTAVTLVQRTNFVNDLQADLLVSVHCNSTDEESGSGLEVLYKSNKYKTDSKKFATMCLESLTGVTGLTNRGLINGNKIYIIRKANMPTVLLELGFLTDSGDLSYLTNEENRKKMAETICQVIWKKFEIN